VVTASLSERSPAHLPIGRCRLFDPWCIAVCVHRTRDVRASCVAN
jgi:hypothetical protein